MIEYIEYHNSKTNIMKTFESITWNYHLKYVISVLLQPQCNDISSYLRNYKKKYGNQYQIPIFINAKTILVVIYGYRALSNYAVNIFSIKKLVDKDWSCEIHFENTQIEIQKKCRYIKSSMQRGLQLHKEMMENIFI